MMNEAKLIGIDFQEQPELVKVPNNQDSRTEKELKEGTILFQNHSLIRVDVNQNKYSQMLRDTGISPALINKLEVRIRDGHLANRDANNQLTVGYIGHNHENEPFIELYSTIQTNYSRIRKTQTPMTPAKLSYSLLHELKHFIQETTGETLTDTFHLDKEGHDADPQEIEAEEYARKHITEAKDWIAIKELLFKQSEQQNKPEIASEYENYGQVLDFERSFSVTDTDPEDMYWLQSANSFITSYNENPNETEDKTLKYNRIINRGIELSNSGKLGVYEFLITKQKLESFLQTM